MREDRHTGVFEERESREGEPKAMEDIREKIMGGLFGLAIGDALGATTEFMSKREIEDTFGRHTEIVGGGWLHLRPGATTDDTAMALAVVRGIVDDPVNPIRRIGQHFIRWYESDPLDVGGTVRAALDAYDGDWFMAAKEAHDTLGGRSAGNGTLMRCLPVALAYADIHTMASISSDQSRMTHYDGLAADSCVLYNRIVHRVLLGEELCGAIEAEAVGSPYEGSVSQKPISTPSSYVVDTLSWALYIAYHARDFEEAVVWAANEGGDADTTAAVVGGLVGTYAGYDALPVRYVEALQDGNALRDAAEQVWLVRQGATTMGGIIAIRGNSSYLVQVSHSHARVLDLEQGKYFPPYYLNSILARGYWEPFSGSNELLNELKGRVEDLGTEWGV